MLKIADFGWCAELRDYEDSRPPTGLAGTFPYMAPEVLQNGPQTLKVQTPIMVLYRGYF